MSITKVDDKDFHSLIEKLHNGDEKAFDEIYRRYCAPISFLCQKFCDNKEDAEEVTQDTFVIAFKKSANLRSDTLLAYLRKIAVHECFRKRDKNRLNHEYLVHSDSITDCQPELDESFLPEDALQNKELQAEFLRIINQLPKNRREMVYLYYYTGFNTEEIARLYDCTSSTVRNTLSAARSTIKSKLESTDKKYAVKGVVLTPLAAMFIMEEQVFAASYISSTVTSIAAADVAAKAAIAKSGTGYIIAACMVVVCSISVAAYIALSPNVEENAPTYEQYTALPAFEPEPPAPAPYEPAEEAEEEPYTPYEPQEYTAQTYEPPTADVPQAPPQPAYVPQPVPESEAEEEPLYAADEVYEYTPAYEPPAEEPPEPQTIEEPTTEAEPYTPEPIPEPIDRTPEILAALAAASNADGVARIIGYYGFMFDTQIHLDMLYRFYVLDDGSGDILIGIETDADGTSWRMKFTHYPNGTMPSDILQLLRFMEQ